MYIYIYTHTSFDVFLLHLFFWDSLAMEFGAKAVKHFFSIELTELVPVFCSLGFGGLEIIAQCHWRHIGCGKLSLDSLDHDGLQCLRRV